MGRRRDKWTLDGTEVVPGFERGQGSRSPRDLTEDDVAVVFQPIVELNTGKVFAQEALVRCRWPHFQNPLELFNAASTEGSCGRVGRLIRHVAIARAPTERLFLNVHPDELSSRWLVRPDDPLSFHDAETFLEVTESTAFTHFDLVAGVLKEVCARAGAYLVVDDFGAGYSNLKRILDLEPKIVKLDRELITNIHAHHRQQVMVKHMVALCAELGALVVAEGIETPDELGAVQDAGVHFGQGYLFAKPGYPLPNIDWDPDWKRRGRATAQIRRSLPPDRSKPASTRPTASSRKRSAGPPSHRK